MNRTNAQSGRHGVSARGLEALRIEGDRIAEILDLHLPDLFPTFGLPTVL
ncbi:MAG: hypothetical protein ACR2HR_04965 [Euzebya sp.]